MADARPELERNRYAGACMVCRQQVRPGEGWRVVVASGAIKVRCRMCGPVVRSVRMPVVASGSPTPSVKALVPARTAVRLPAPPASVGQRTPVSASASRAPVARLDMIEGEVRVQLAGWLRRRDFDSYRERTRALGARYEPADKTTRVGLAAINSLIEELRALDLRVEIHPDLASALQARADAEREAAADADARADALDTILAASGRRLFRYQRTGARWLAGRDRALLADEMGLGKTIQVVAALPPQAPVIVVCPATAKAAWRKHVGWRGDYEVVVLSGRGSWLWPAPGQVVVLNYDLLPAWLECDPPPAPCPHGHADPREHEVTCRACADLVDAEATRDDRARKDAAPEGLVVVGDEIDYCRKRGSKRTRRMTALCELARAKGGRTWGVTGTPLANRPDNLWTVLGVLGLQGETWGTWKRFREAFGGRQAERGGTRWDGGAPEAKVPELLRRVMLMRRYSEVMPDMPARRWEEVTVEVGRVVEADLVLELLRKAGIDLATATAEALQTAGGAEGAAAMARARAALAAAKLPALLELVEQAEEQSEDPILVFCSHLAPLRALAERQGWAMITGETPARERERIEADFQAGLYRGLALSTTASRVSLTLTRAHHAIFVDRDWTPTVNAQAEGRIYRVGQTRPCLYTLLVADHAVDRRVSELLWQKAEVIEATVHAAAVREDAAELPTSPALPEGVVVAAPAGARSNRR